MRRNQFAVGAGRLRARIDRIDDRRRIAPPLTRHFFDLEADRPVQQQREQIGWRHRTIGLYARIGIGETLQQQTLGRTTRMTTHKFADRGQQNFQQTTRAQNLKTEMLQQQKLGDYQKKLRQSAKVQ